MEIALNLPSQCLTYKDVDTNALKIRTFLGKDGKLLAEITADNFDKKLNQILQGVVAGIDCSQMTLGDRMYCILWEAINSYNKMYPISVICENCVQKIEVEIDLSTIDSIKLPNDYTEPHPVMLSTGKPVNMRLYTVKDMIDVAEKMNKGVNTYLYKLALSWVEPSLKQEEKTLALEEFPEKEITIMRAFHDKYIHGPTMESTYKCPLCENVGAVDVPFRPDLLWPYGKVLRKYYGA